MGTKELRNLEQNPSPINNVKGLPDSKATFKDRKGFLKGKGPVTIILFLLLGGGVFFFTGQSLLGPHISSLFTEATDIQFTSYSLRNQRLFKFMMDGGNQIRQTPFTKQFTTFTPYMKSRLAKNNIEVGHLNDAGDFVEGDLLAGKSRVLRYNGSEIITANDFQLKYAQDANFREAYYKAKRGRIAGMFDDLSDRFYRKVGLTRNIFDDFVSSGNAESDARQFVNTMNNHIGAVDTNVNSASHQLNDNGTPDNPNDDFTEVVNNGNNLSPSSTTGDTPEVKARNLAHSLVGKVDGTAGVACSVAQVANLANITAHATSVARSINFAMGFLEPISRMQAAASTGTSAVNNVLNNFTTSSTTSVPVIDSATGATTTKQLTGSMLDSNSFRVVLGNIEPTSGDIAPYSLESINTYAKRTIATDPATTQGCNGFRASSALISLASVGIPGGSLARVVLGLVAETVGNIAIAGAVSAVIAAIVPTLARVLFTNVMESSGTGIAGGELFGQGINAANTRLAQNSSGYTPASADVIERSARNTATVLAQEAEIDRNNRSPFDITSKNTFLGNIVSSFLPLLTSSNATSPITTLGNITSDAISTLVPGTYADSITASHFQTTYGDCPTAEENGWKGTIHCDTILAHDPTTIDIAPDDPTYQSVIMSSMHEDNKNTADPADDTLVILDNSELAKFITFCAGRESPWGITDVNILNALQTDYGVILNNLPFLNDVVELVNAAEDTANMGWATGQFCSNTSENAAYWHSQGKYYQRFIEDSRILGQMGAYEDTQSPLIVFLEKYDTEHPADNSPQGYLARITGSTTTDIAFLLEFIDYSNFLASYDPSTRASFAASATPQLAPTSVHRSFDLRLDSRSTLATEQGIPTPSILYTDTRTRSHAI